MKVIIWVHKDDIISGNITKYYKFGPPQSSNWPDYVQVIVSTDEFARLEDDGSYNRKMLDQEIKNLSSAFNDRSDDWKVKQYNRNRSIEDQISNIDELESDQDNQPFAD